MGKPKEILFGSETRTGIGIEYIKSKKILNVWGWYDTMVGIEGDTISLKDFCNKLGITEKDLKRVNKK